MFMIMLFQKMFDNTLLQTVHFTTVRIWISPRLMGRGSKCATFHHERVIVVRNYVVHHISTWS